MSAKEYWTNELLLCEREVDRRAKAGKKLPKTLLKRVAICGTALSQL